MTTAAPPLRRGAFRRWLEGHDPDAVVGRTWLGDQCPLARYLGPGWEVDGHAATFEGPPRAVKVLPTWAVRFAYDVDDRDGHEITRYVPVLAKTALWLLDGVEADLAAERELQASRREEEG